jgi:delta14-sterol reductase
MSAVRNPKTTHYEFFGPPGATFVSLTVPLTIYGLYFACSETSGGCPRPLRLLFSDFIKSVLDVDSWVNLFDTKATVVYFGWYAFTVAAWYFLPGDWVEGTELRTGGRLKYKINGSCFPVSRSSPC